MVIPQTTNQLLTQLITEVRNLSEQIATVGLTRMDTRLAAIAGQLANLPAAVATAVKVELS